MKAAALARLARKLLLTLARRADPERAVFRSRQGAMRTARWAARVSPAYGQILREHGLEPSDVGGRAPLAALPVLTKENTFGRFPLASLARETPTEQLADVLTSSGRSGRHFGFRLTERRDHERSSFWIDLGLEDAFKVDSVSTLLVNCLPMGVVFRSKAVTVANVSVREDMACAILRDIGPRYGQTLLCTDPLFVRRLLDQGDAAGVDWRALNTSVIIGEEMLVEEQRDYIAARMGIDLDLDPHRTVASSFGVGELGLNLLFESRATIRIRRASRQNAELARILTGSARPLPSTPGLFCYSPQSLCLEVLDPDEHGFGELCFTMLGKRAVIPLPRFATGDLGRLVSCAEAAQAAELAGIPAPWLPMVLVRGRIADQVNGHPSVEAVKALLYSIRDDADRLTGAFRIQPALNGQYVIRVQTLQETCAHDRELQARLQGKAANQWPGAALTLVAPDEFPDRPMLDFERKLAYVAPSGD